MSYFNRLFPFYLNLGITDDNYYDHFNSTNPLNKKKVLNWRAYRASTIKSSNKQTTPALSLLHELVHAYDRLKNRKKKAFKKGTKKEQKWRNTLEKRATKKEQKTAKQLGEPVRKDYLDKKTTYLWVQSPTSTKKTSGYPKKNRAKLIKRSKKHNINRL